MSGMLPGVELARKRRMTHRHPINSDRKSKELSLIHQQLDLSYMLDEKTLSARTRLDEKLRGSHCSTSIKQSLSNSPRSSNKITRPKETGVGVRMVENRPLLGGRKFYSICLEL
ncbi:hypothetical protein GIB67_040920 [Kingdonia uniflora]|uniref:Uncharacterized protein n=1 Tax=Kingdonia uniflora TaxID=39325 RepID=A0A7J7PCK7_9MAGN|nr:hypothetical protein GIB67_040920 [Kingdonia uniflora]